MLFKYICLTQFSQLQYIIFHGNLKEIFRTKKPACGGRIFL